MSVEREEYNFNEVQDFNIFKKKVCVTGMKRHRNGEWWTNLDIELEIILPDGRIVSSWVTKSVKGRQLGRRK